MGRSDKRGKNVKCKEGLKKTVVRTEGKREWAGDIREQNIKCYEGLNSGPPQSQGSEECRRRQTLYLKLSIFYISYKYSDQATYPPHAVVIVHEPQLPSLCAGQTVPLHQVAHHHTGRPNVCKGLL